MADAGHPNPCNGRFVYGKCDTYMTALCGLAVADDSALEAGLDGTGRDWAGLDGIRFWTPSKSFAIFFKCLLHFL